MKIRYDNTIKHNKQCQCSNVLQYLMEVKAYKMSLKL